MVGGSFHLASLALVRRRVHRPRGRLPRCSRARGCGPIGLDLRLGLVLSGFDLGWDSAPEYFARLAAHRPAFIRGYPSSLALLARRALSDGAPAPQGLKAVFTSSELLKPEQRELIERAFGARVADLYGHAERAVAAGECPQTRLHVFPEYGFLEVLPLGPPGRTRAADGEIVATSFHKRATPFVRYRTGDLGRLTGESCPCGRGMPVLRIENGRAQEFLVTPEGKLVSATAINFHSPIFDGVERFCFVQEDPAEVVFEYTPLPGAGPLDESAVAAELRRKLGPAIRIRFRRADSVRRTPAGKHRFIISTLDVERAVKAEGPPPC